MNEVFSMNEFNAADLQKIEIEKKILDKRLYQLISKQENCFEAEFSVAKIEEVLKAGTEELHDHDVVVMLHPVILDQGDAHPALHHLQI